jgi:hypothetical protein
MRAEFACQTAAALDSGGADARAARLAGLPASGNKKRPAECGKSRKRKHPDRFQSGCRSILFSVGFPPTTAPQR